MSPTAVAIPPIFKIRFPRTVLKYFDVPEICRYLVDADDNGERLFSLGDDIGVAMISDPIDDLAELEPSLSGSQGFFFYHDDCSCAENVF